MGSLLALSSLFCAVKATSFLTVAPVWCEWELFAGEQIAKRPYSRTWLSRLRVWISLSLPDSLKSCAYDEELTLKFQTQLYFKQVAYYEYNYHFVRHCDIFYRLKLRI